VPDTPIYELISRLLRTTGYLDYASALPGGAQRALNLRMLIDKAVAYSKTSYTGLFHFVNYIESLQKQDADFGELSTISEAENVVRILSVHKSKGLEYPVVFAAGLHKTFNRSDLNAPVLLDPELGMASEYVNLKTRLKAPTLLKEAIARKQLRESLGEEQRVLYVALTRAREKLILILNGTSIMI
jgi:ATP-dependent helicase/nuclease subunit A